MRNSYSVLKKLAIINLAEKTNNVTQVSKQFNVSRTQIYSYKKRFNKHGVLGLIDAPPLKKHTYNKYSNSVTEKILSLAIQTPAVSCSTISKKLKKEGVLLSSMAVFKILKKYQLENKKNRWKNLEHKLKVRGIKTLSSHQKIFLSSLNPYFTNYKENKEPAQCLSQDIISIKWQGQNIYLYVVVDIFSNYTFAILKTHKDKKHLIKVLQQALDFMHSFDKNDILVRTSELNIFQGKEDCLYQKFLSKHNITQEKIFSRPQYDGCIQHFSIIIKKILQDEQNFLELQKKLQIYLLRHNHNYRYKYYPHYGKPPIEMLKNYLNNKALWSRVEPVLNKNHIFFATPLAKMTQRLNFQKRSISFVSMLCSYELFDQ